MQVAVRVKLEGSGLEATASEDDGVSLDLLASTSGSDGHGDNLAVGHRAAGDFRTKHVVNTLVLSGRNKLVVEAHAGHAGWQGCDLEHLGAEDLLEVSEDLAVVIDAEHGRQGDNLTGIDESPKPLSQHSTGTSIVEGASDRQAGGVVLALAGLKVDHDSAGGGMATARQRCAVDVLSDETSVEVFVLG